MQRWCLNKVWVSWFTPHSPPPSSLQLPVQPIIFTLWWSRHEHKTSMDQKLIIERVICKAALLKEKVEQCGCIQVWNNRFLEYQYFAKPTEQNQSPVQIIFHTLIALQYNASQCRAELSSQRAATLTPRTPSRRNKQDLLYFCSHVYICLKTEPHLGFLLRFSLKKQHRS